MATSVDVTAGQAGNIVQTVLGLPNTTNKILYMTVTGNGQEVFSFIILLPEAQGLVFYPKKADGTYLTEAALLGAFPNAVKVNAVG